LGLSIGLPTADPTWATGIQLLVNPKSPQCKFYLQRRQREAQSVYILSMLVSQEGFFLQNWWLLYLRFFFLEFITNYFLKGIVLCTITSHKMMMKLNSKKAMLCTLWKSAMMDGLLEHLKDQELLEHSLETMWPKFKELSTNSS